MQSSQNLTKEVLQLTDAVFDKTINAASLSRLEELITSDLGCLQTYIERVSFHGDLMKHSIQRSSARQAAVALDRVLLSQHKQSRRLQWFTRSGIAACALIGLLTLGWFVTAPIQLSPQVGKIATLSSTASDTIQLGQIVRSGETYSVETGIVSLQLPHVTVDLIAPTTLRLQNERSLELISGAVHSHVQPGGEGFQINTPDSAIVDLGTEFIVKYHPQQGTEVLVRRGRVQADLLDQSQVARQSLELTAGRSAIFSATQNSVKEISYSPQIFELVDQTRGNIASIDGTLRTLEAPPVSLTSGDLQTPNHVLVIPEQQHVTLSQDLILTGLDGPIRLPAGTTVSSYLIHYDPDDLTNRAPRGAVTFNGYIVGVLVHNDQLQSTDSLLGLPDATYEQRDFRDMELDEDEIRISDDRRTVSMYLGVSGPFSLDQARILVLSNPL